MNISEVFAEGYVITYDNPSDYAGILKALQALGRSKDTHVKTTIFLHPNQGITAGKIKKVVEGELKQSGNALIISNFKKESWHIDKSSGKGWEQIN